MRVPSRAVATPSETPARRRPEFNLATFSFIADGLTDLPRSIRDFNHDSGAASLNLKIELLDEYGPLRLFAVDVGGVFLRARRQRIAAIGRNAFAHGGRIDQGLELLIEFSEDLFGRIGWRQQAVVQHRFVAREAGLTRRWDIGK